MPPDEVTPNDEQQISKEAYEKLQAELAKAKEDNSRLLTNNQKLQSTADTRASRISSLQNQLQGSPRGRSVPPNTTPAPPVPTPVDEVDEGPSPIVEAAILRIIAQDSELTLDDVEGWEDRVTDPSKVQEYIENIKLRKEVAQLKKARPEAGVVNPDDSVPPVEADEDLEALSLLSQLTGTDARKEVAQHVQTLDTKYKDLRSADPSVRHSDEAAAKMIELAHSDPRKRVLTRPERE